MRYCINFQSNTFQFHHMKNSYMHHTPHTRSHYNMPSTAQLENFLILLGHSARSDAYHQTFWCFLLLENSGVFQWLRGQAASLHVDVDVLKTHLHIPPWQKWFAVCLWSVKSEEWARGHSCHVLTSMSSPISHRPRSHHRTIMTFCYFHLIVSTKSHITPFVCICVFWACQSIPKCQPVRAIHHASCRGIYTVGQQRASERSTTTKNHIHMTNVKNDGGKTWKCRNERDRHSGTFSKFYIVWCYTKWLHESSLFCFIYFL